MFVAVSSESTSTACSTDGINWTESDKINLTACNSICYGANKFVAVGKTIEYATKVIYTHEVSSILNLEARLTALETAAATSALSATTERSLASRDLIDIFYPVGSVYTSTQTDPSERFGGSWSQLSVGISGLYFWQRTA